MKQVQGLTSGLLTRLGSLCSVTLVVHLLLLSDHNAVGAITMQVYPSPTPHNAGPSWSGYVGNALNALENGLTIIGDPSLTPTAYYQISATPDGRETVLTGGGTNSWLGYDQPGTVFGPAFAGEYGNRIHFGLHILGEGTEFKLTNLDAVFDSTDSGDTYDYNWGFVFTTFAAHRVGINYGPDQVKGGGDDITYTSGSAVGVLLDELLYVGVGSGVDAMLYSGSTTQEKINNLLAYYQSETPFIFSTAYSLYDDAHTTLLASGYGAVQFGVPEPSLVTLLALGGLLVWRRRQE